MNPQSYEYFITFSNKMRNNFTLQLIETNTIFYFRDINI